MSSTESVAADFGPLDKELVFVRVDFDAANFDVDGVPLTLDSSFIVDGAFNPPILLVAAGLAVVGRDNPEAELVPKDVPGLVLAGAFKRDGAGVLAAAAPVAVGLFNPPPIDGLGLTSASLTPRGDALMPPLDEFMLVLLASPGFVNGVVAFAVDKPSLDYVTPPTLPLFGTGVDGVVLFNEAVVEAVVGLIPVDILDVLLVYGAFYNVSTKLYNFLISSLTFSICTFI
jgi:hypothetical protein